MAVILIVDDRAENRDFLVTLLGYKGHTTLEACDGAQALEIVRSRPIQLVITDVLMPAMDGYEFVRQVRADPKIAATPVIFYTAKYHKWELNVLAQAGGILMIKPAEPEEILKTVDLVLNEPPRETALPLNAEFDREHLRLITDKLASKVDQLEAFLKLGQELALERDPLKLLEVFTKEARNVLGAQSSAVVLHAENGFVSRTLSDGWDADGVANLETAAFVKGVVAKLCAQSKAMRWTGLKLNPQGFEFPTDFPTVHSLLCAPMVTPSTCYGVLFMVNKRRAEGFTEDDEQAAATLARQSAIAYENARRHEVIKLRSAELELEIAARVRTEALLHQRIKEVAEGKRLEKTLRKQTDDLTEANRAKDEFLAVVSHELRTPLTAMLGWIRMLRGGRVDRTHIPNALAVIERNTLAQAKVVEDLLDVSKMLSGKMQVKLEPHSFEAIVDGCLETVHPTADAKGVRLNRLMNSKPCCIDCDAHRLQQAVNNLLSNAVKFTPKDGVVTVATSLSDDGQVVLKITDTGIGIASEFLPRVFERFSQADASSTRSYAGLGLGLSIVRNLVDLQGGRVSAQSDGINSGSTFTLTFPLSKTSLEDLNSKSRDSNVTHEYVTSVLNEMRILLVEDNQDTREMLLVALQEYGAEVELAGSAGAALNKLEAFKPDIIISDIGLPDMDGFAFIRKLRSLPNADKKMVPAIALTAYATSQDHQLALDAGFQTCVTKPVEPATLALALVEVVAPAHPE